jgi:hypothetical protein
MRSKTARAIMTVFVTTPVTCPGPPSCLAQYAMAAAAALPAALAIDTGCRDFAARSRAALSVLRNRC